MSKKHEYSNELYIIDFKRNASVAKRKVINELEHLVDNDQSIEALS